MQEILVSKTFLTENLLRFFFFLFGIDIIKQCKIVFGVSKVGSDRTFSDCAMIKGRLLYSFVDKEGSA